MQFTPIRRKLNAVLILVSLKFTRFRNFENKSVKPVGLICQIQISICVVFVLLGQK